MKKYFTERSASVGIRAIAVVTLFIYPLATAQVVRQARDAETKPYVSRGADGIQGCGIQIKVVDDRQTHADQYTLVLAVSPEDTYGVIQGGRLRLSISQWQSVLAGKISLPKPSGPAPESFWITREADAKPLVPIKLVRDKKMPAKLIALVEFDRTLSLIADIAKGARTQFDLRYPGDAPHIMRFSAPLNKEDKATVDACFDGYMKRLDELNVKLKAQRDQLPDSTPRDSKH
ncbi:hypothetical protein [Herbaspirillum sp. SJZ107]|uniref:hypothetical protein n=1 Tax=Herbaspirillum sp. SJZ107 TaxID=2572881 RepID=UPI00114DE893|nr:hypothetical protein [Herbaspirillum sp. SJZ107]TQK06961.1 hypothetical protein FBX97_2227 [Herbaspirillum sp. SJZ107]